MEGEYIAITVIQDPLPILEVTYEGNKKGERVTVLSNIMEICKKTDVPLKVITSCISEGLGTYVKKNDKKICLAGHLDGNVLKTRLTKLLEKYAQCEKCLGFVEFRCNYGKHRDTTFLTICKDCQTETVFKSDGSDFFSLFHEQVRLQHRSRYW
jgi:translation initiation factor 2 beta subunit (eIF-2beta)/eIF-5